MTPPSLSGLLRIQAFSTLGSGPCWVEIDPSEVEPFREAVYRKCLEGSPWDAGDLIGRLVSGAFAELSVSGLSAANDAAARWLGDGHLPGWVPSECAFHAALDVKARSATRTHLLDGVLYVDGIALAVLATEPTCSGAAKRLEQLQETCPRWFVTPFLLVAIGTDGAALGAPGVPADKFKDVAIEDLALILEPLCLRRLALLDAPGESVGRSPLPAGLFAAVERALGRALAAEDGLISIAEGAGRWRAVLSLAVRLLDEGQSPVILSYKNEHHEQLTHGFVNAGIAITESPSSREHAVLVISLQEAATLQERAQDVVRDGRVVVAFGVDAGFRGEQGFAVRLLWPEAPWISLTTLPPEAVPPEALHAFANPSDPSGFLAVVEKAMGRVPVHELFHPIMSLQSDRFPSEGSAEVIQSCFPEGPLARGLVLVESHEQARSLAFTLRGASLCCHDATEWGSAHEGWSMLRNPQEPTLVIRTTFPFWIALPHLDAAFIVRKVGPTTLGRLRNLLGRAAPGKSRGLLVSLHPAVAIGEPKPEKLELFR